MRFTRNPTTEDLPGATHEVAQDVGSAVTGSSIRDDIIEVLKTIYDPEIPVNIYELGLIYEINMDASNFADIKMTLTSPACPVAGTLPPEVEAKAGMVPGVSGSKVELIWDPPWDMSKMSEAAKLQLNLM